MTGLLKADLVEVDLDVASQEDLFAHLARKVTGVGYVRDSFEQALADLEAIYPTALPTQPEAIAIPHTDAEHIITPFIAPVRLRTAVRWAEMGNDQNHHDVRFVFLLGLDKAGGQVKALQALTTAFQDPTFFTRLADATGPEDYLAVVQSVDGLEN